MKFIYLPTGCLKIDATIDMIMTYYWDKLNDGYLEHVL